MNRATKQTGISLSILAALTIALAPQAGMAKKQVTITDRVQELSSKIDAGQKSNELTLDEANGLRDKMTKVNEKIEKCKSKNGGKLSYKDENSIEKDLNKISVKIQQEELSKRTAKPSH